MTSSGIRSDGKAGTRKIPGLKPIEPGSVFSRDIPAIYIVFESAPLEDPAQFSAQWFLEGEQGALSSVPLGKDTLEVPGHERYGFLELKKPGDAWDVGTYLVKLFITPLGQQSFHAGNQVGTMRFTIVEGMAPGGNEARDKDSKPLVNVSGRAYDI